MFCALNGATRTPCARSQRQRPAVTTHLPASECVPATSSAPFIGRPRRGRARTASSRTAAAPTAALERGPPARCRRPRAAGRRRARADLGRAAVAQRAAEPYARARRRTPPPPARRSGWGGAAPSRRTTRQRLRGDPPTSGAQSAASSAASRAPGQFSDVVEPRGGPAERGVALVCGGRPSRRACWRPGSGDARRAGDRAPQQRATTASEVFSATDSTAARAARPRRAPRGSRPHSEGSAARAPVEVARLQRRGEPRASPASDRPPSAAQVTSGQHPARPASAPASARGQLGGSAAEATSADA